MREKLELERMRADRSDCPFAMLVFAISPGIVSEELEAELGSALKRRLRAIDAAGYLDDGRIAALLPATGELGAHILAGHVREALDGREADISYNVYIYPQTFAYPQTLAYPQNTASSAPALGNAADIGIESPGEPQPVDCLLVQSLPRWKRTLDIAGAIVGLLLAAPVITIAALCIRATSRGPVFFSQKRTGIGGRVFTIYKLRTMCIDAESTKHQLRVFSEQDGPAFKMKNDPRVTRVGRYLRKACIDELPQLWNVLIGDMSLVGPRPLPCDEADSCHGWQQQRLHVTPGLTCTWQAMGGVRVPFQEWMRMDVRYVRGNKLWVDLALIWKTIVAVITHRASH